MIAQEEDVLDQQASKRVCSWDPRFFFCVMTVILHLLLQVAITVVDNGIKIADKINITWGAGYCQINVPENSFPSTQLQSSTYLNFIPVTRTGFILFGGTILFVAILGMKCSNGGWFLFFFTRCRTLHLFKKGCFWWPVLYVYMFMTVVYIQKHWAIFCPAIVLSPGISLVLSILIWFEVFQWLHPFCLFDGLVGIAGIWGCVSRRARARWPGAGSVKYQELEMSIPTVDSSKKDTEDGPLSAEGWDEIWEDNEWEDTEAVRSSSSLQTLSSQGLNVRRANKDGRDSAWDD